MVAGVDASLADTDCSNFLARSTTLARQLAIVSHKREKLLD